LQGAHVACKIHGVAPRVAAVSEPAQRSHRTSQERVRTGVDAVLPLTRYIRLHGRVALPGWIVAARLSRVQCVRSLISVYAFSRCSRDSSMGHRDTHLDVGGAPMWMALLLPMNSLDLNGGGVGPARCAPPVVYRALDSQSLATCSHLWKGQSPHANEVHSQSTKSSRMRYGQVSCPSGDMS
jgi:hypothetical protein